MVVALPPGSTVSASGSTDSRTPASSADQVMTSAMVGAGLPAAQTRRTASASRLDPSAAGGAPDTDGVWPAGRP